MKKNRQSSSRMFQFRWKQFLLGLFGAMLVLSAHFFHLSYIPFLDYRIYDRIIQMNLRTHPSNPRVVIVDIDNESVAKEGRWPWPRNKMADLVNKLKKLGVVTIGLDIVMAEPEVNYAAGLTDELQPLLSKLTAAQRELPSLLTQVAPLVDNDRIFAQSLLEHNVVLGFLFHNDWDLKKGELPAPLSTPEGQLLARANLPLFQFTGYNGCLELFLKASTQAGAVTNLPDPDGSVRHGLMLASYDNKLYATLSLAIAMNYLMVEHAALDVKNGHLSALNIGGISIPLNEHGQVLVPFWGAQGTLSYYSATDVLQGKVDAKELQGAIAIVGSTMILLADLHHSPISESFPGVEMVGNMVQGIISKQLATQYDWYTAHGQIQLLAIALMLTFVSALFGVAGMLAFSGLSVIVVILIAIYLFATHNVFVPIAVILILILTQAVINYGYLFIMERRQKRKINQLFGQYVPEEYVKELIEFPDQSSMEGQVRNMTVQFSDIRNFTGISETLEAQEVKRLLNAFFTPITEIIFSFRGTIDKYVGDMIVAFWGAPMLDEEHAYHAVLASLNMLQRVPEISEKLNQQNLPAVTIGIGLATGLMNVGDMGSEFRRAYTVLGDTVNLASRLQDLTKFYQVNILVSDGTRQNQDRFVWRVVDKITVKGRKTGLTIYQPLGLVGDVSAEVINELEEYHQALNKYYARNWSFAEEKFSMLKEKNPSVYLYQMYLARIQEFKGLSPDEKWDGIYVHQHK